MKLREPQLLAIAHASYTVLREYGRAIGEREKPEWHELTGSKRTDIVIAVVAVLTQHVSPQQQHERWLKRKLDGGWTYGERRDEVAKTHPAVRPYAELAPEQRAKGIICCAVCFTVARLITTDRQVLP